MMLRRFFLLLLSVLMFLYSVSAADSWSVTIPDGSGSYAVVNVIIDDEKFYVIGAEIDSTVAGYPYSESTGLYLVEMEDGKHKAMKAGDNLFYELVPGGATVMLSSAEPYDERFSSMDGSFKFREYGEYLNSLELEKEKPEKRADVSPIGMWSCYWDARELNKVLGDRRMSFDIMSYSLFLMEDGSAHMQQASVKNGKGDFSPEMLSGIWIGDASDMTILLDGISCKAWIDDSGRLFYKMTDDMAIILQRIVPYDYNEGFLR